VRAQQLPAQARTVTDGIYMQGKQRSKLKHVSHLRNFAILRHFHTLHGLAAVHLSAVCKRTSRVALSAPAQVAPPGICGRPDYQRLHQLPWQAARAAAAAPRPRPGCADYVHSYSRLQTPERVAVHAAQHQDLCLLARCWARSSYRKGEDCSLLSNSIAFQV